MWDSWYFPISLLSGVSLTLIYSILDGPSEVVLLPTYNGDIVQTFMVTCGVSMVINGGQ